MASQRPGVSPEPLSASGRSSNRLSLLTLQSKMKSDPEGYKSELVLVYSQFKSSLELFQQQATLNFTSITGITTDPAVAKDLGDRAMLLAHVTPFYPQHLADFPKQLSQFLASSACSLPSGLRCHIVQSLIPPANRKQEDEAKAKRSLITLCELHRRRVWFDDRTADAICTTCFHSSSRIMIVALSFLLYYEKIQDKDHSDASSSEDDLSPQVPQAVLCKEAVYKAHHKGTVSSKKKKQAKIQSAIRSMKRQQRLS